MEAKTKSGFFYQKLWSVLNPASRTKGQIMRIRKQTYLSDFFCQIIQTKIILCLLKKQQQRITYLDRKYTARCTLKLYIHFLMTKKNGIRKGPLC